MDTPISAISRRDFLKLASYGILGLSLPDLPRSRFKQTDYSNLQGRVTADSLWMYDEPSLEAKRVELYWRDLVIPITGAAISEDEEAYNRVWYEVDETGFVYSGSVQPVSTVLNLPAREVPPGGLLGEVSVPFTDAHKEPDETAEVAHRLYYETVHWITQKLTGFDGEVWYCLLDDKFDLLYYIPAKHMRVIPDEELAPLSPDVPNSEKLVEVHLPQQLVLAFESSRLVFAARAATGGQFRRHVAIGRPRGVISLPLINVPLATWRRVTLPPMVLICLAYPGCFTLPKVGFPFTAPTGIMTTVIPAVTVVST